MTSLLLLCGGPSEERNISLNSARSVYDHLEPDFEISIVFVSSDLKKYLINGGFLYSNTTSDFDFKLANEGSILSESEFVEKIKESDIVFSVMHGKFAEDGQIQKILEDINIPFVGSGSVSCNSIYNKHNFDNFLNQNNYYNVPKMFFDLTKEKNIREKVTNFFEKNNLAECIVKPVSGGSSFGVSYIKSINEAVRCVEQMSHYEEIMLEERCIGKEFTVIVLQNKEFNPVALLPTEIEVKDIGHTIFDTRRKYLATNETHYHCPPRFSRKIIDEIRNNAKNLFSLSNARDFLRIDGWVLDNGNIYFSDVNPISGMEQNSFIFQQSSKIGFSHREVLNYIIDSCARRNKVKMERKENQSNKESRRINVIFGGSTSERQVSLLSGSNVYLKIFQKFNAYPFLLFKENRDLNDNIDNFKVVSLPYNMILNHTVEEILFQCSNNNSDFDDYINIIRKELGLQSIEFEKPEYFSLREFLEKCKKEDAYLFIALHGGFGEGGGLQHYLEEMDIDFNGSLEQTAKLCMNKFETSNFVNSLNIENVRSSNHYLLNLESNFNSESLWNGLKHLGSKIVVKPNCDGSSSGIVVLESKDDLENYLNLLKSKSVNIPKNIFKSQDNIVNMGENTKQLLFEEFIDTDDITIENENLVRHKKTGWIELTVGVLEKNEIYHSLNPSITVTGNQHILSVEEKFQGGTGINITPPPENLITSEFLDDIKRKIELISKKVKIKDYCRIDIFVNTDSHELIVIEFNTLPALTPSTVIFQQAEKDSMTPKQFIGFLIFKNRNV